ncbi:CG12177 [Drosophila busckii]|uniref:CG12177 n=1 Tax=Drosophila busckii TaxID=30019 RepID=A0A0M5JDI7_DROBS|nr:pyrimidine-specific ribonucleoside hydrolase RihA [Drosophila busckii]ALC48681.1 CG12177 [Drosophila busckii]
MKLAILDCDGGSDDAWALLLLLRAEQCGQVRLLAVTTTGCGNTTREHAARNMRRILNACKRSDVPIYLGAVEPLIGFVDADKKFFHGIDGFGDCLNPGEYSPAEPVDSFVQHEHAVTIIHNLCMKYSKQITIVAVGPMTNLALGYTMYGPEFGKHIKDIYMMGGNYQGVGNSSRAAEFNFHSDPEAAYAVLLKTHCPITILPWEPCTSERFNIPTGWRLTDFAETEAAQQHLAINMLTKVESAQWLPAGFETWNPCDALAVAAWLWPKRFIKQQSLWHATVDLTGTHTRGQMVLDHLREREKFPENVHIIELVDDKFFKEIVEWVANWRDDTFLLDA